MKVSARNVLSGKVSAIKRGAVNAEVDMTLQGGHQIVAVITNASLDHLGLAVGSEALALIKAPLVILAKDIAGMKFSARNLLEGKVKNIAEGAVNAEVTVELGGGLHLNAIVTEASITSLELKAGDEVAAMFKASSIILAVKG
jgi:molybdate transport system regulatory protein